MGSRDASAVAREGVPAGPQRPVGRQSLGPPVEGAERLYHVLEPENRLVSRTLEARREEALKRRRRVEEDHHRFLASRPAMLSEADR